MTPLTRQDVAHRIMELPAGAREAAVTAASKLYDGAQEVPGSRAQADRDPEHRRRYAGDPWSYFADVLGVRLTDQQQEALELIEGEDRVLIPAGNNLGKTFLLAGYGLYRLDAVAALPDEDMGLEEQGAKILLSAPDHGTIEDTIYAEMLTLATRAEVRGYRMPGDRSEKSVNWQVRPKWNVEAFSPAKRTGREVAHEASGRHHRNQVALVEEGQGVAETVWRAAEGMCSSAGNKIVSSFNPTEPVGPAYQRARDGSYQVLHLSAFDHPNVEGRTYHIRDAVDYRQIDRRVRRECQPRGPYPDVMPDEDHDDFVYAVPPEEADPEAGPREDGFPGHPEGELRVYRPGPTFTAQVLGLWPKQSGSGLFDPGSWDEAVQRWRERRSPPGAPDRVGLDPAREGDDESCGCPAWGETAEAVLRAYAEAQNLGPEKVRQVREERRIYVGRLEILEKGDGPDVANEAGRRFPNSPLNVDIGGVGASVYDHLNRVMGRQAADVTFGDTPPEPTPGEPWSENLRTAMYVRAAMLVRRGLADVPPDAELREELMAHELEQRSRTVKIGKKKRRVPSVQLIEKAKVKDKIGRSPDRADAFVLSLHGGGAPEYDPDEWQSVKM